MSSNKTYLCHRCQDTGVFQDGMSAMTCPFCAGRLKFMASLKQAIKQARIAKRETLKDDLLAIHDLLPDYPVMAVMEAEYRGMRSDFIAFIKESFDVRPMQEPIDRYTQESGV